MKSSKKVLIYLIVFFYLSIPKLSYSQNPHEYFKSHWVEIGMVGGLIFGVVKYSLDMIHKTNRVVPKYSAADSAYLAIKYVLPLDSLGIFKNISSEEERIAFSENYWKKFDPYPHDPQNEFKEEFDNRVQYANKHFSTPYRNGWRTDKGRIFILYGKPSEVKIFPFMEDLFTYNHSGEFLDFEIWCFDKPGGIVEIPYELKAFAGGRVFFLFGRISGNGTYEQIYSSELGELNQTYLFQKPIN